MGKRFSDVSGQKNIVRILDAQLESAQVSHAYLFLGNKNQGKKFLAKEFAKNLLEVKEGHKIENHPDFIEVDGSDGIKIADVREAIERINLSPTLSARKVLLITEAQNMGIEAANALLKTIEEPPLDSIILITAITEKSLPQTIVSRSQKIKIANMPEKEIIKGLKDFPEDKVGEAVALSGGSFGEAKKLLTDTDYFVERREFVEDILKFLESKSVLDQFKTLTDYEKEKRLREFFDQVVVLISKSVEEEITGKLNEFSQRLATAIPFTKRREIVKKALNIYENLEYNVNLRWALEEIVLEHLS